MRSFTLFLAASVIAAAGAAPALAQFSIVVQRDGQASTLASGATISLVAPGVGQSDSASITVTYFGSGSVNFASPAQVLGASFSLSGGAATTLTALHSATFTIQYTAATGALASGQFLWPFTETVGQASTVGQLAFGLQGTSPNVAIGQLAAGGGFTPVPGGGTIQFPGTVSGATSSVTVAVDNLGSAPASISSVVVTGAGFSLQAVAAFPVNLPAGNQLSLVLQFAPTSAASFTGTLQISFAGGSFSAVLAGSGVAGSASGLVVGQSTGGTGYLAVPSGGAFQFTSTIVGSTSSLTVGIYNPTATAITLSSVSASGASFQLQNVPLLPLNIPAGGQLNVAVQFSPGGIGAQTGAIQIASGSGTYSATLSGTGVAAPVVGVVTAAVFNPIPSGGTIPFGSTIVGSPVVLNAAIQNPGALPATVNSVSVIGAGYSLSSLPSPPLVLPPNGQINFNIQFLPTASGIEGGYLQIAFANGTYTASLAGTGLSGVLPAYSFTGASGAQAPFTQPAIGLSLAAPFPATISGVLTISVASDYFAVDPAVQFSTGGLSVPFTIPANSLNAVFPNGTEQIQIQSGTVASQILITPSFTVGSATGPSITPANPATLGLSVPAAAPALLTASFTKTSTTTFTVALTGYTTTRSLTNLTFQFTPRNGAKLTTTSVTIDVTLASALFFSSSSTVGGLLNVSVPFTLGNGAALGAGTDLTESIASIAVTCANGVGTSNSVSVVVP